MAKAGSNGTAKWAALLLTIIGATAAIGLSMGSMKTDLSHVKDDVAILKADVKELLRGNERN